MSFMLLFRIMYRFLIEKLRAWLQSKTRKPLILKGARQVGKTHLLLHFARSYFPNYYYFNFEKEPGLSTIFEEDLDPLRILKMLGLHRQKTIDYHRDLIIFDEIQACPKAITSLKYFYEDLPEAFICAAGSLLGVYLNPGSYPVGKVDHLEMYPMSFIEFLMALGDRSYVELLQNFTLSDSIPDIAHSHLWDRLKHYFVTGGLPEVVKLYCDHQQDLFAAFTQVREKQNNLIQDYFADIAKHSGKINAMHIDRIWRNIPEQLARSQDGSARKFKFKQVISGIDRYSKLSNAIDWLESAGLIIKVSIINKGLLPFKAYVKENMFKLFLFDVGMLGALSEINPKIILDYTYGSYKGFFAENYIAQAFVSTSSTHLYSWTESTAEIEFVREIDTKVIPIEVKSGWVTQAKSLKVFVQKYNPDYRVIFSVRNMSFDRRLKVLHLPLYLAEQFPLSER